MFTHEGERLAYWRVKIQRDRRCVHPTVSLLLGKAGMLLECWCAICRMHRSFSIAKQGDRKSKIPGEHPRYMFELHIMHSPGRVGQAIAEGRVGDRDQCPRALPQRLAIELGHPILGDDSMDIVAA